jgi:hypothetical protein
MSDLAPRSGTRSCPSAQARPRPGRMTEAAQGWRLFSTDDRMKNFSSSQWPMSLAAAALALLCASSVMSAAPAAVNSARYLTLDVASPAQVLPWSVRLPITIEVKQDVEVLKWDYRRREARGKLYLAANDAIGFWLRRGQRFQMIKIEGEGQCHVRVLGKKYLLMSCPWLEGFGDHQSDIFAVVTATPAKKKL